MSYIDKSAARAAKKGGKHKHDTHDDAVVEGDGAEGGETENPVSEKKKKKKEKKSKKDKKKGEGADDSAEGEKANV
jgi:hypothetical protein